MRKSLEGHESLRKAAEGGRKQPGDGRRQEDELMGNASKYHRSGANIGCIECRTGEEAGGHSDMSRRKSQKAEGAVGRIDVWSRFIASSPQKENEEEMFDIQKREESGGLKSETRIEMEGVAIETIERTPKDHSRAHKTGQNWIWK
jgi:hypothetical protein